MNYYNDVEERIKEYQPNLENREELYANLHLEKIQERKQAELNWDIVEAYRLLSDMVRTAYGVSKTFGDYRLEQLTDIMNSSHYIIECFEECRKQRSKEMNLRPIIKKHHLHCNI